MEIVEIAYHHKVCKFNDTKPNVYTPVLMMFCNEVHDGKKKKMGTAFCRDRLRIQNIWMRWFVFATSF